MEQLGEALERIRPRRRTPVGDSPVEPEPEPSCPICKDYGFVRKDVPVGDVDFGRAIPCMCRMGETRERLRRRSNLGPLANRTFDTFDPKGRQRLNSRAREILKAAYEICRSYGEAPLAWLVLHGPPGVGKTHLSAAIANRQIELGNEVFFAVVPDLLDHLRASYGPQSDMTYDELFEYLRNVALLILDDLGTETGSPWAQEKLFQLLNHRYNAELPTVVTTNHRLEELDQRIRVRLEDKSLARVVPVQDWRTSVYETFVEKWPKRLAEHTFENFSVEGGGSYSLRLKPHEVASLKAAYAAAVAFAESPSKWLVFVGEGGRGKTHLAAAIKNYRSVRHMPTLFLTVPDLLHYLRATYDPTSHLTYDEVFETIASAEVLILDDYGKHYSTPWAEEKLFQLLNHRFNEQLPTVITTSVPFDLSDTVAASQEQNLRILARLLDGDVATIVRIDAPAFRRRAAVPR